MHAYRHARDAAVGAPPADDATRIVLSRILQLLGDDLFDNVRGRGTLDKLDRHAIHAVALIRRRHLLAHKCGRDGLHSWRT